MSGEVKANVYEDEIEAAKANEAMISEDEKNTASQARPETRNVSLVESDIHIVGDRAVTAQVVQLLSYIRHALRNNMNGVMMLSFGNEAANPEFNFDVNSCQVPDLVTPADYRIN